MNRVPVPGPSDQKTSSADSAAAGDLYASPEFLIRRAHQIASATFAQACSDLELTPSQYSALFALRQHARVGQNELGRAISLDRSTTSLVLKGLKDRGLVNVVLDDKDRRKTFLELSDSGRLLLARAEERSALAGKALLSVFDRRQAEDFMQMLRTLAASQNDR